MKRKYSLFGLLLIIAATLPVRAQEILPFLSKPSGSTAGRTMQGSMYSPLPPVNHLPKEAPNILIVLIDDVGPAPHQTCFSLTSGIERSRTLPNGRLNDRAV